MKIIVDTLPHKANACSFALDYRYRPIWSDKAICKLKISNSSQLQDVLTNFNECELCDLENNKSCQHLLQLN